MRKFIVTVYGSANSDGAHTPSSIKSTYHTLKDAEDYANGADARYCYQIWEGVCEIKPVTTRTKVPFVHTPEHDDDDAPY